jgi:excisionase family DNA binding protein
MMAAKKRARPEVIRHPLGEEVYTLEQVAQSLQLSKKYLYRAIKAGRLRATKTGKQFLLTRSDVRTFWESLPKTNPGETFDL